MLNFKCKTCNAELVVLDNSDVIICSKCGRKYNASEIYLEKKDVYKNKQLEIQKLNDEIVLAK